MKKLLFNAALLVAGILSGTLVSAQKQANNWYFGTGAGITFASGTPVALTNCSPLFNCFEGVGTISDAAGNLLFYSDGNQIFNANHQLMPNGSGLFSNSSSTQTALIIKQPGNQNLYYVFTNDLATTYYSVVDMNLQGGLGDVTATKNVLLRSNSTERGTMVRHANGIDFWIITHDASSDAFAAFLITAAGVNPAVVSNTGMMVTSTIGAMKVSPTGNKIGVAGFYDNRYELHDFNSATGVVSNSTASPANYVYAYGCEFSPDGSKLYGGKENSTDLWQFDLNAGANVWNTATLIANTVAFEFEQMQLGPDGKIYTSLYQYGYLGVINDPNQAGLACNYVDNGVYLQGKTCYLGLPQFEPTMFNIAFTADDVCLGDSTHFTIPYTTGLLGVNWDFGDPGSGPNNVSSIYNPSHLYTAPGAYVVQLITANALSTDTVYDSVFVYAAPTPNLGPDTTICDNMFYTIDAGTGANYSYQWSNGETTQTIAVNITGSYTVTISNGSCTGTSSIIVTAIPCTQPNINFSSSDSSFCEKQCIDFFDLSNGNPISWQWTFTGASPNSSTDQNPVGICYNNYGSFDVQLIACNTNGCDTLTLTSFITELQNPVNVITQSNDTLYSLLSQSYQWYELTAGLISGATNQFYVTTIPGSYYCVTSDTIGCVATSNIIVISSIFEHGSQSEINFITPNPNSGSFTITTNASLSPDAKLKIYDVQGREVFASDIEQHQQKFETHLSNGAYVSTVYNNGKVYYQRLFIKK